MRGKFKSMGLDTYDCLAPGLMDAIAGYSAKKAGTAYDPAKPAAAASAPPKPAAAPAPAAKPAATPPPAKKGFFARLFGG